LKKLLLVPVVLVTGFLAFAFLMPATAATLVRSVAPVAHLSLPSVLSAGSQVGDAAAPAASTGAAGSSTLPGGSASAGSSSSQGSSATLQGSASQPLVSVQDRNHEVATAGHPNCGRFGDGMHGGKHDFTCPNRPFPEPAT
jgi:hypothetical protein